MEKVPKSSKGFASWPKDKLRAVQSLGGRSVPKEKRAFSDHDAAVAAGKAGARKRWGVSNVIKESKDD